MSPKDKAYKLLSKYSPYFTEIYFNNDDVDEDTKKVKECALIAVDEIIDVISTVYEHDRNMLYPYWEEVKQEIENICNRLISTS